MNLCAFENDITKGLGRSILTVKSARDKEPYRKCIVSFIENLEGKQYIPGFDRYLYELISLFPDRDAILSEITPVLISYLRKGMTLNALPLLLRLGYEADVREIMEEMYRTSYRKIFDHEEAGLAEEDISPVCQLFTCASMVLVRELHGEDARTMQILYDIADLYDFSDTPYIPTRWNPLYAFTGDDKTLMRLLETVASEHRNGKKLLAQMKAQQDYADVPAKENLTLDDLLRARREDVENYYAIAKAFRSAPDSLVREFSAAILREKDLSKLATLVSFFNFGRRAPNRKRFFHVFPYDPGPIIEIAEQNTEIDSEKGILPAEIWELYMFLSHIRHHAVRTWGEKLRTYEGKNDNFLHYGIITFVSNYIPKDGVALERMVKAASDSVRPHWVRAAVQLITDEEPGISDDLIRYCFYTADDCISRLHILSTWMKRGTVPPEIITECRYDAYDEIRRLVESCTV